LRHPEFISCYHCAAQKQLVEGTVGQRSVSHVGKYSMEDLWPSNAFSLNSLVRLRQMNTGQSP
jgi:hypothetical protein